MKNPALACISALSAWLGMACSSGAAGIKPDERVVFYPALARATPEGWKVELHGLVYEPQRMTLARLVLRRALGIDGDDLSPAQKQIFKQRAAYFLVDNERDKKLTLTLDGREIPLGSSAANGHFQTTLTLRTNSLAAPTPSADTNFTWQGGIATHDGGTRAAPVEVVFLHETGLSVISDIDDTIKISDVRDKHALVMNTFCEPFRAAPGMAAMYRGWAGQGAQFHYVSASPWQLYLPLAEFARSNGFPAGTFHMKSFRVKDSTFLNILKSPERYKPGVIGGLLKEFPKRRFVLVGDSGEKDPEIYGALARKFPAQVKAILIRDVTDEPADSARYRKAFDGVPREAWQVFKEPATVKAITFSP